MSQNLIARDATKERKSNTRKHKSNKPSDFPADQTERRLRIPAAARRVLRKHNFIICLLFERASICGFWFNAAPAAFCFAMQLCV